MISAQPVAPAPEPVSVPPLAPPTPPAKKKTNTALIIAIVVVVVLCCCCILSGILAWYFGDTVLESMGIYLSP